jgi:hypothetical protein
VVEQDVARDREQVGAKGGTPGESVASIHARQEGVLDEVLEVALSLVLEESGDRREVSIEENAPGFTVSLAPCFEQFEVGAC